MDKFLALDVETTGFSYGKDITMNHQILSIGLIVSDGDFNPVDQLYVEIKWDGETHWNAKAEAIHGLTKEYLEENGLDGEDAALAITEFLLKHYRSDEAIFFLGHNPKNFDVPFFEKLMHKYDIYFKVAHRTVDSFSVGYVCLGAEDSDQLFANFYKKRKAHNALDDAAMSLGVCRKLKKVFKDMIDG